MVQNTAIATPLRLLAGALATLASSSSAEDFSWQISGGYAESELAPYADNELTQLDATYYFDPVDDTRGPYALAPFLNRSTRVTAGLIRDETTIETPIATAGLRFPGTPTTFVATEETTGYAIGGRYVWPQSGWYAGGSYRDQKIHHEPRSPLSREDTTVDGYQVFGGRYFGESTSLDLGVGATQQTSDLVITCITSLCLSGNAATHVDTDDWSIGTLHFRRGARLNYSIFGRVSRAEITPTIEPLILSPPPGSAPLTPTVPANIAGVVSVVPFSFPAPVFAGTFPVQDERDLYSLGGELFPTDRLGLRIGLARVEGDYVEDESYDLTATWFLKRGVAVELALARTESEIGALERNSDSVGVRFLGRL